MAGPEAIKLAEARQRRARGRSCRVDKVQWSAAQCTSTGSPEANGAAGAGERNSPTGGARIDASTGAVTDRRGAAALLTFCYVSRASRRHESGLPAEAEYCLVGGGRREGMWQGLQGRETGQTETGGDKTSLAGVGNGKDLGQIGGF